MAQGSIHEHLILTLHGSLRAVELCQLVHLFCTRTVRDLVPIGWNRVSLGTIGLFISLRNPVSVYLTRRSGSFHGLQRHPIDTERASSASTILSTERSLELHAELMADRSTKLVQLYPLCSNLLGAGVEKASSGASHHPKFV
jgi:hypothetical protein